MTGINTIEEARQHPLWSEQEALEQEMRSLGVDNYRKNAEKAVEKGQETRIAPVRRMMQDAHHKMVDALNAFYADVEAKKAGSKYTSYKYLRPMDTDVVAHLTCRVVLDMGSQRKTLTHLSVILGEALEDECNYRHFEKTHKPGYLAAAKRVAKSKHQGHIRRSVKASAGLLGVDLLEWPKKDMVNVGSKLIELFIESTGMVALIKTQDKLTIELTQTAKDWMEKEGRHCELLAPTYLPTLIPPRPWTSPFDGGYWTNRAKRLTLVKKPGGGRAYLTELADREMPEVYQGINALQNTAWHVNQRVYTVMSTLWDEGSQAGVIPLVDPQPLPTKPFWLVEGLKKEDMTEEQQAEFRKWKAACAAVHEANAEEEGRRASFIRTLWVAEKFKNREEFFFPHALDWRGRAYPVPLYLHPQGSDPQRGLLEFAEMIPINDQTAADWLMIHGAGLWGKDKGSFEERIDWVKSVEAEILAAAADPYENNFWMFEEKDGKKEINEKAWQALAFCFDYAGFVERGFGYMSRLPVQMDGTCNGIQNFSAMLLDERGGAAVNLVPADRPQDIYMEVGKVVIERVNTEAAAGNELAAMWVGNVNRKVVKRPVMTLAYGAKRYGFTEMVMTDTVNVLLKKHPEMFDQGRQGFGAAQYMAGLIWDAVQEVVVAAASAMKWLQEVASIVTKEALPLNWITPTGLHVQQVYRMRNMKELKIAFQNVRIAPRIDFGGSKLDSKKQASGIAPNWVHSLDASHMTKTICASTYAGVQSFSFIHDSYGTHAGNTQLLADILRQQFVSMYSSECVLQRFKDDLEVMMGGEVKLPPVPPKGTLDLSKVLESKFFFA